MFDLTLTFDNGPEPDVTPGVLRDLARHDIRATFFVVGSKLLDPARRALLERAADEGHWIGNHTFTHSVPLGLRREPDVAESEIGRTQALIGSLAHPDRLFRPFGGGGHIDRRLMNPAVVDFLCAGGFTCVLWNAIPRDWNDPEGWRERALEQIRAQPWTLMVLHDLPTGAMRHLDGFIGEAKAAGARFRQDFPPACVPIRAGAIVAPLDELVAR
ncbi:MAG TPA: polysaccharide deacetylase family protein [Alphaproteobacteria bacterium]|nr:polysaccharide deacetylase family protein [Alphaproteobacteria bacterium]